MFTRTRYENSGGNFETYIISVIFAIISVIQFNISFFGASDFPVVFNNETHCREKIWRNVPDNSPEP